jgi:hypothetical protein
MVMVRGRVDDRCDEFKYRYTHLTSNSHSHGTLARSSED